MHEGVENARLGASATTTLWAGTKLEWGGEWPKVCDPTWGMGSSPSPPLHHVLCISKILNLQLIIIFVKILGMHVFLCPPWQYHSIFAMHVATHLQLPPLQRSYVCHLPFALNQQIASALNFVESLWFLLLLLGNLCIEFLLWQCL